MQHKPIKSSNLHSGAYNAATGRAEVTFKGKDGKAGATYVCEAMPAERWNAFEKTFDVDESSGKHYFANLRSMNWKKR